MFEQMFTAKHHFCVIVSLCPTHPSSLVLFSLSPVSLRKRGKQNRCFHFHFHHLHFRSTSGIGNVAHSTLHLAPCVTAATVSRVATAAVPIPPSWRFAPSFPPQRRRCGGNSRASRVAEMTIRRQSPSFPPANSAAVWRRKAVD